MLHMIILCQRKTFLALLKARCEKKESIDRLLQDSTREHYISPRRFRELIRPLQWEDKVIERLVARCPTKEGWRRLSETQLRELIDQGEERELSGFLLKKLQA